MAESFESADTRFQLVEHAYRVSSLLWEDNEVTEFASLVSRASQISALGQ